MENQEENTQKKSNKSLGLFIALFAISMALNVFLFFRYAKKGMDLEKENQKLSVLLEQSNLHADSLQRELDFTIAELENKLNENLAINEMKDEYRAEMEQKLVELKAAKQKISSLIASGGSSSGSESYGSLAEARNQINELRESNTRYIQELDETQRLYAIARDAVDQYSISSQEYEHAVDSLVDLYRSLNESVAEARVLRINDLNVYPIQIKKDVSSPTYKASKVKQVKISFSLSKSSLVEVGPKEVIIRIIGTSGEVLSDNVKQLTNSDELYSLKKEFDYDGKEQFAVLYFTQEAKYKAGRHKVQVIFDGKMLDTKEFILY